MKLLNKRAVITGGARGIGLAIAQRYLAEGASVVVADIDAKAIEDALTTLQQDASAERVMGVVLNVCDQALSMPWWRASPSALVALIFWSITRRCSIWRRCWK